MNVKRFGWLALLLLVPACQQKMAQQPYYRPFEESTFFKDGTSARPLERGVVARGQLLESDALMTGLKSEVRLAWDGKAWDLNAVPEGELNQPLMGAANAIENFTDEFPFEVTKDDLIRGMERYQVFCVPCHGSLGNGRGKIAERGYLKPTSYHTFKLEKDEPDESSEIAKKENIEGTNDGYLIPKGYSRGFGRFHKPVSLSPFYGKRDDGLESQVAPVGYFFEVITKGYGGMPSHASQIPPADRWRIIAYVRALQFALAGQKIDTLPKEVQDDLKKKLGGIK